MSKIETPSFFIVAGPNGAGKTTFINGLVLEIKRNFKVLNYDLILKTMNKADDVSLSLSAGKELIKTFNRYKNESVSFIYETVLSDNTTFLQRKIIEMQQDEWQVVLFYIWISSYKISKERVNQRVVSGGHPVPEELLRKRYDRSINNLFKSYLPICHSVICYENDDTNAQKSPNLVFVKNDGKITVNDNMNFWRMKHL